MSGKLIFPIILVFLFTIGREQKETGRKNAKGDDLIIGIGGHPLSTVAYNANASTNPGVSYDTQVAMLTEMGLSIYRIDVYTEASGKSRNHDKFISITEKCRAAGITVLPMIYDRCKYSGTPAQAYAEAFAQMAGFAKNYGKYFQYFELGNEMELFDELLVSGNGRKETDYDMSRLRIAEEYIRGMEDGLKSVLPDAKSMVNTAGFFPVFWMDRMLAAAPTINICAWHVYPEMLPLYKLKFNIGNIHKYLFDRYQRPIWYTETNVRAKQYFTSWENEKRAYEWRKAFTSGCSSDPNVKAVLYHELLDNPERTGFEKSNFEEENFGFVKFTGYPGKKDKAAYDAWKRNPGRYRNWSYKKSAKDLISLAE